MVGIQSLFGVFQMLKIIEIALALLGVYVLLQLLGALLVIVAVIFFSF